MKFLKLGICGLIKLEFNAWFDCCDSFSKVS
jgi:hypothetical protein